MMKFNKKTVALLVSVALLLTLAVGSTVAYLAAKTTPVVNTFTPGSVVPTINETFNGTVKKDVTIKNSGNVKGYFRAVIIVTWQDGNGNVYPKAPVAGEDYTLTINTDAWTKNGGYYYYNNILNPGETTPNLIKSCQLAEGAVPPKGYNLHVAIAAQGVQAEGTGATGPVDAFTKVATAPSAGN